MPKNCKYCITGFLFLLFPITFSQAQNSVGSDQNYVSFQKKWEHQINLLRSNTEKPEKYDKVYAEMPPGLFGKAFSDSSFVTFGISDPISDTTLAYNMAANRALLMANLLSGMDLTVFYNFYFTEQSSINENIDTRFSQYYVVESQKNFVLKDSTIKLMNFMLTSGETFVFLYKHDLEQETRKTDPANFKFSIWLSEYQHHEKYEPIKRISLECHHGQTNSSSYVFSSSGKLSVAYTLMQNDSISNNSKFYVYKNTNNNCFDSTYSRYPLNNGIWTAYLNTLVDEIIKHAADMDNGKISGMTDKYNNQFKSYSQNIETNVLLDLKLLEVEMLDNDLYLKTVNTR